MSYFPSVSLSSLMLPNLLNAGVYSTIAISNPERESLILASFYPSMVIAGLVGLSILGTGGAGCAVFSAFTLGGAFSFAAFSYADYFANKKLRDFSSKIYLSLFLASNIVNLGGGVHLLISNPFKGVTLASTLISAAACVLSIFYASGASDHWGTPVD
ncbi:MAG: hypothetical protein WC222_02300 [Parachlamydiales bacterium]|jgi:hypothetical protein